MLCYARALTQYHGVVPRLQKKEKKIKKKMEKIKKKYKKKKKKKKRKEILQLLRCALLYGVLRTSPQNLWLFEDTVQSSSMKSRPHTKAQMARRSGEPEISFFGWWIIVSTATGEDHVGSVVPVMLNANTICTFLV
jgi:hypothetical protein